MIEVEKFYNDKIAILNEILKRERKEREILHNTQVLFLEKSNKQKRRF